MPDRKRTLLWHGALLFLFGLLTGLATQQMTNPRMGVAAHLEGLMNGTFLIAVGAAWSEVRLAPRQAAMAYWLALYGAYANWLITTLAAIFGTAAMTPIASAGHKAGAWQEKLVAVGFASVAVTMILALVLLLIGWRRASAEPTITS
jgi:hydroxylaminobenzene mutase